MTLQDLIAKYSDYQVEMRRYFHQHPEESAKEFKTAERIRAELDKLGVQWRPCGMGTGTLARISGKQPGRTILLRGDIDALSVKEETGLPYASTNPGVMHACGHDCHISMLLTAVHMIHDIQDQLKGTVVFAFQPAEASVHAFERTFCNHRLRTAADFFCRLESEHHCAHELILNVM